MRTLPWTAIIALTLGLPATSAAQTTQSPATTSAADQYKTGVITPNPESHWMASGFVGSNFGRNADPGSGDFGGSIAYLWKSKVGAEFDTGFTPNFQHQSSFFGIGITPQVSNYMGNLIGALPLGADGAWQPYISGGGGAISLKSDLSDTAGNLLKLDASKFGSNVGAGLMAFAGNWGFKADFRYFRTSGAYSTNRMVAAPTPAATPSAPAPTPSAPAPSPAPSPSPTPAPPSPTPAPPPGPGPYDAARTTSAVVSSGTDTTALGNNILSGLAFWRANVGVAFRW